MKTDTGNHIKKLTDIDIKCQLRLFFALHTLAATCIVQCAKLPSAAHLECVRECTLILLLYKQQYI